MKLRNGKILSDDSQNKPSIFVKRKASFETWMSNVNKMLYEMIFMYYNDLPDEDYWNYWNDGFSALYMVKLIIKKNEI